jgi:hypothetical protein
MPYAPHHARFRAPFTPPPHTVPHRPFNEAEKARQAASAASFPNLAGFTVSISTLESVVRQQDRPNRLVPGLSDAASKGYC